MLSLEILQRLSSELKIDRERIVREYYEILLLHEISKQEWSTTLVFKGGTALRLAYGSPRFSDDLDFSIIGSLRSEDVFEFSEEVARNYTFTLRDAWEKKETILVEYSIRQDLLPNPIRLKMEISKRRSRKQKFELMLLKSPAAPFEVLFKVQTLTSILDEKRKAFAERKEPRDLFDLWYLSKKLGTPLSGIKQEIDRKRLKQTLNKYLPGHWQYTLDEIDKEIKKSR
jgi:predicted nucleotidyltransferase component of viral defense system